MGYGRLTTRSRSFSRQHRITHTTPNGAVPSRLSHTSHGFANATAYALSPRQPSRGMGYLPASLRSLPTTGSGHRLNHPTTPKGDTDGLACLVSPASARALLRRYQNINWLSIDYACRPRLRSRLTLGGLAWPRNPWSIGGGVSHSPFATHACILTRVASTTGLPRRFTRHTTLPYPSTHLDPKRGRDNM